MPETWTVTHWQRGEFLNTGTVGAFDMRPQKLKGAAEPYCTRCGENAWPLRVSGRWDEANGYTARPFDPVYVRMSCGCEFGDDSLAYPASGVVKPVTTDHAAQKLAEMRDLRGISTTEHEETPDA